jgi:hypothetical protein
MNEISEALGNHEIPPEKQDWRNPAPMLEVVLDACGRGGAVARTSVHASATRCSMQRTASGEKHDRPLCINQATKSHCLAMPT